MFYLCSIFIDMKFIISEDKREQIAIHWLNNNYGDLTPYKKETLPDYTFFVKDGKVVFEYDKKNGVVYISYNKIWSFLENFLVLEPEEIQDITKKWVKENYKLRVTRTKYVFNSVAITWRNTYDFNREY